MCECVILAERTWCKHCKFSIYIEWAKKLDYFKNKITHAYDEIKHRSGIKMFGTLNVAMFKYSLCNCRQTHTTPKVPINSCVTFSYCIQCLQN